jgi:tetratricopeptide (TPR) repeat protein
MAWVLATAADPARRDAVGAVELARKAVELVPNNSSVWNTLGTALYRAGDWPGAIEPLRKSNELDAKAMLAFNAAFLAMALHRRGDARPARIWFDVARRWHVRSAPNDEELERFRAEAAGVLDLGSEADLARGDEPADDATLGRLILQADPGAVWARAWLGSSTVIRNRPTDLPGDVIMPNGREAFSGP